MEALIDLDQRLFLALNGANSPAWMDSLYISLTRDETLLARLLILGLFLFLIFRSPTWRRRALWLLPLIAIVDSLNSQILKEIFMRPRPCHELFEGMRLLVDCGPAYSFPSSHAANMGAVGIFLALGARGKAARAAILAIPLLVAYSRIHVGVHYPADVLFGFLEGAILALIWDALLRFLPARFRILRAGEKPIRDSA
jgi:undecaprenyl-diphosphatase